MPTRTVHAALTPEPPVRHDLMPVAAKTRAHRSSTGLVDPAHAPIAIDHRCSGRSRAALEHIDAGGLLALLRQKHDRQSARH
jgi:hypothetical protein